MNVINFPSNPIAPIDYSVSPWTDQNGKAWMWSAIKSTWEPKPAYDDLEAFEPWERNPAWIEMPLIAEADQKMHGIMAVTNDAIESNRACIYCYGPTLGTFLIDWGDGHTDTVSNNTTQGHQFDFNDLSADTEFVLNGGQIARQCLVTVTPISGNITRLMLSYAYNGEWQPQVRKWLHISVNMPYLSDNYMQIVNDAVFVPYLEQVNIGVVGLNSLWGCVTKCSALREVTFKDTSNIVDMRQAFYDCRSLRHIPYMDTSNVTSLYQCFSYCASLKKIPLLDFSSVTYMPVSFNGCTSLRRLPNFNFSNVTDMGGALSYCKSLEEIPMWDTSNVENFSQCFYGTDNFKTMVHWNTSSATNMSEMFRNCTNLETVPLLDMANNTTLFMAFSACYHLKKLPVFNTTGVTNTAGCFAYGSLHDMPDWDMSSVQNAENMFNSDTSLTHVPDMDLSSCTSAVGMFDGCYNIKTLPIQNLNASIGVWRTTMSTGALVDFFNSLPTVTGGQALNMTQGVYTPSLTSGQIAIATSKGWTLNI